MRVHHRIVLAIVAVLGAVACKPDLTVTATEPPHAEPASSMQNVHVLELTDEQAAYLAAVAWRDAEARAFLEHVAAVRAGVPPTLRAVRWCEAGSYVGLPFGETNYAARTHGEDGASGGYQMVKGTWLTWASAVGVDVAAWPRAYLAPDWIQDLVATHGWADGAGSGHWDASRSCWA